MFKGINDKLNCLVIQTPHSGSTPHIVLNYCIHKIISLNHLYRPYTDPVWVLWPLCGVPYQTSLSCTTDYR